MPSPNDRCPKLSLRFSPESLLSSTHSEGGADSHSGGSTTHKYFEEPISDLAIVGKATAASMAGGCALSTGQHNPTFSDVKSALIGLVPDQECLERLGLPPEMV